MTIPTPPAPTPLEELRLDRDWSYQQLADAIERRTGVKRSDNQWRLIALGHTQGRPGTRRALERFLDAERKADAERAEGQGASS